MRQTIERIQARLYSIIGLGRLTADPNDAGPVQTMQLMMNAFDNLDPVPRVAEYGLTSMPPAGSDTVVAFIGGDRSNGVVVATGHKASRPKGLLSGDVCLYNNSGQFIKLASNGTITIEANGQEVHVANASSVVIDGPVTINGKLTVNDDIVATGSIGDGTRTIEADRAIYDSHTHSGVQTGSGHTGVPDETE